MKKSKLSLGLISCLLSVGSLAGCDTLKSSKDGVLLKYTINGVPAGEKIADDILKDYYNDSTKYQAIFDTIYSVIARNYFSAPRGTSKDGKELGLKQMDAIYKEAREKVSDDKDTAQSNADTNNTKYKKELEAIFESKGVEDETELYNKYVAELQKETFESNIYNYFIDEIKEGGLDTITYKDSEEHNNKFWKGYFEQQLPYHVSHILIKLEDSSGTNYANGTISKQNAIKLADVVDALGAPEAPPEAPYNDSFETVANFYSDDTVSAESFGDLGIMDYSTSYIDEFKLGVYAYENFYYTTETARTKNSEIDLTDDSTSSINKRYNNAVKASFDNEEIPTIDKSVFAELREAADIEKDQYDHQQVLEGNSLVFPRNIIYNKYLNRHAVAFITGEAGDALAAETKKTVGYWKYAAPSKLATLNPVLSAKVDGEWTPILCVRGGSSDYQGIHFIVINRSAFELGGTEDHPVTRSDYYTTYYPEQDLYPSIPAGRKTYINFSSDEIAKTKARAEKFVSELKGFESDRLKKYIFKKYMEIENIKIEDEKLNSALTKWIDSSIEEKEEDRSDAWTEKWNSYIDTILRQNSERNKLVPQACKVAFLGASKYGKVKINELTDTDLKAKILAAMTAQELADGWDEKTLDQWFKVKGGLCNDGKEHL